MGALLQQVKLSTSRPGLASQLSVRCASKLLDIVVARSEGDCSVRGT